LNLRWAVSIANLAVLVFIGYMMAGMVFRTPPEPSPSPATTTQASSTQTPARPARPEEFSGIVKRDMFASAKAPARAAKPTAQRDQAGPLKRTTLQLRLLGTIAGDADIARAVIEDTPSKVQDLYKVGDTVQGARIESIERTRVVLAHGGGREVLELYLATSGAGAKKGGRPDRPRPRAGAPPAREAVKVISPNEFEINKKAFLARVGGMEAVLKTAKLTPHLVDGKCDGLSISGLANVSMARFVGLQDGDVIQAVNGQRLRSEQKAFQVFRKARRRPALSVDLLRGQDKKKLLFSIK